MRTLQVLIAGFLFAAITLRIVILVRPPASETADTEGGAEVEPTSPILVGP